VTHPVAEDVGPATLTVVTAPEGDAVVVALGGDLDIASVPAVRERLLSLLRPGASRLVIDMSAVRYADASGLEVLVSTQRRAVLLDGTLRLAALQPEVARVLTVTGLSRHLATYPTVQAAVAGRKPGAGTALPGTGPAVTPVRALPAQADAGTSYAALVQAARSLLSVLGREPLTYSPAVAATASRLRRLFPAGPPLAMG
jgi:anti-sigma B factor antagonist